MRYYCKAEIGYWVRVEGGIDEEKVAQEALARFRKMINDDYRKEQERLELHAFENYPIAEAVVRAVADLRDYEIVVRGRVRMHRLHEDTVGGLRAVVSHVLDMAEGHVDTVRIDTVHTPVTTVENTGAEARWRLLRTTRSRLEAAEEELRAMDVAASPEGAQQVRDEIQRLKEAEERLSAARGGRLTAPNDVTAFSDVAAEMEGKA